MDRHAHVNFVGRALLQQVAYLLRQMPEDFEIEVDVDAYMKSISFKNDEGDRESLEPWSGAPNAHTVSAKRLESMKKFATYEEGITRFVPALTTGKVRTHSTSKTNASKGKQTKSKPPARKSSRREPKGVFEDTDENEVTIEEVKLRRRAGRLRAIVDSDDEESLADTEPTNVQGTSSSMNRAEF